MDNSSTTTTKTISPAKLAANRRNSLKSTGPKTERGKKNARFNALKHGLLASQVVLRTGSHAEDPADFNRLLADLWTVYQPVGILEELTVEGIGVCYWRKARALRAERGDLQARGARPASGHVETAEVEMWVDQLPDPVAQSHLRGITAGRDYLRSLLREAREDVQRQARVQPDILIKLEKAFDSETKKLGARVRALQPTPGADVASATLQLLDEEQKELERLQENFDDAAESAESARRLAASIPHGEALNGLLRYEASIDRQLRWLIEQLERLQSARHGEMVVPPVPVPISATEQ